MRFLTNPHADYPLSCWLSPAPPFLMIKAVLIPLTRRSVASSVPAGERAKGCPRGGELAPRPC